MAATLIRKPNENGNMENLFFKTEEIYLPIGDTEDTELHTYCTVSIVDNNLKNIGADVAYYEIGLEDEFHKSLRNEAANRGHLITSHSTNPEWNPEGYEKHLEHEEISDNT